MSEKDEKIQEIKKLSKQLLSGLPDINSEVTTIYALFPDENLKSDSLNRIFGKPIGVNKQSWPKFEDMDCLVPEIFENLDNWDKDTRMEHVLTVDLRNTKTYLPDEIKAVSLFVSSSQFNEAFEPDTDESAVVLLKEKDISKGESAENIPLREYYPTSYSFTIIPIEVPEIIFFDEADDDEKDDENSSDLISELRNKIFNLPGYIGKYPLWLQGDEEPGDGEFIMQFSESLIPEMNLGDSGEMYIFTNTAFWQCY